VPDGQRCIPARPPKCGKRLSWYSLACSFRTSPVRPAIGGP